MDVLIENSEKIALTGDDLVAIAKPTKTKVIQYDDLKQFKSIEEVFGESQAVIIFLDVPDEDVGHWVLLFKRDIDEDLPHSRFYYFDSLGMNVEEETEITKEQPSILKRLLPVDHTHINRIRYQKERKDIMTCGRWVGIRARFHQLSPDEFHNFIFSSKYNPDQTVTLMTLLVAPKEVSGHKLLEKTGARLFLRAY